MSFSFVYSLDKKPGRCDEITQRRVLMQLLPFYGKYNTVLVKLHRY